MGEDQEKSGNRNYGQLFKALSSAQRYAVEEEAGLLREFFGTKIQLSFHA